MIVIVVFIMILKKNNNTFSGHHKYNEPKGPNAMFEII